MKIGIYAGSFDPLTFGHIDIIKRSMKFCDELLVAVGVNPSKQTMFSEDDRLKMIETTLVVPANKNIVAQSFQGLLVDFAKESRANLLIRGIRSVVDFEYETNLANINKLLAPEIETVFLSTTPELSTVSSSAVKEIAKFGGDISKFVPKDIEELVKKKFGFNKTGKDEPVKIERCSCGMYGYCDWCKINTYQDAKGNIKLKSQCDNPLCDGSCNELHTYRV